MTYKRKSLLVAALVLMAELSLSVSARASNGTTTGTLSLNATFENISVKAAFTNDDNQNNSALVEFRPTGTVNWMAAYTPLVDRRASINSTVNPYANQARVSIVGLTPNTSYDVRVTWTDPDGVAASNPVTGTVSTLSKNPPFGGSTVTVTNDSTLTSALNNAAPGQTIHLNPGNYNGFTVSKSGNAGAWIKVECDAGGGSIIDGIGGLNVFFNNNVSFVYLQNCIMGPSDTTSISLGAGTNHIFIVNNTIQAVSKICGSAVNDSPAYSTRYGDAGINISSTSTDIYVFNNSITAGSALDACTTSPIFASPATGIQWLGTQNNKPMQIVICDNTVTGGFRDAITSDTANNYGENVDECRNTVSGYKDDGIESKGSNVNVRLYGNIISIPTTKLSATCVAANTVTNGNNNQYGPLYIFRNTCTVSTTSSSGQTVYKLGGAQTYLLHNTVDASAAGTASSTRWDGVTDAAGGIEGAFNNIVSLNNILVTNGNLTVGWNSGSKFNYDLYKSSGITNFSRLFNGGTTYSSFTSFQSGTGQESNGLCLPVANGCTLILSFLDTAFHLGAASPAIDRGLVLPNFNDGASAWPFSGAAPDIGAFESSGGGNVAPLITSQPQSQTITSGGTATLSVIASGTLPLTYQWYQGTSGNTANPIGGATGSAFTTPVLTTTTSYWVRVTGFGTADSSTATLSIGSGPVITQQPQSQTISSGGTATMAVGATAPGTLTYQWYQGASGNTAVPINGAISNSFTTPALSSTTSYWVRVSSSGTFANSNTATITVSGGPGAPSITSQPLSQVIASGGTASLTIGASGTGTLTYQWYQGLSGDTSSPVGGATSASFTTPALTQTTSYWIRVTGNGTADSNTATITIGVAPSILLQPQPQTIVSGGTANVIVIAGGTGPLSYQWYQGTSPTTTSPLAGAISSGLAIPSLTSTSSYWVRVRNSFGSVNSDTVTVTVTPATAPMTTVTSPSDGAIVSGSITVSATVSSSLGIAGVQFMLDNVNLGAEVTTAPYTISWLSTTASNGTHALSAVARDITGTVGPLATLVTVSVNNLQPTTTYNIPANGGISVVTTADVNAATFTVSHARIQQDAASTLITDDLLEVSGTSKATSTSTPLAGVAMISERASNGILITEAGVPASSELRSGRIYAETSPTVSTGIALSNLTSQDAVVAYYFTDAMGNDFGSGSFPLAANHQMSGFLNESMFNGPTGFQGSFTFFSTVPLGAIAIRGFTNERAEFLFTTVPVAPVSVSNTAAVLPEFVDGPGWVTSLILTNASDILETGNFQFYGQGSGTQAAPLLNMTVNGQPGTTFNYSIPAHASARFDTAGTGSVVQIGSIKLNPVSSAPGVSNDLPSAVSLFQERTNGVIVSQTSVIAVPSATGFKAYMEVAGTNGQPGSIQSGVAITNPSTSAVSVFVTLTRLDGTIVNVPSVTLNIPPGGQVQKFLTELFPTLTVPFQGVANVTASTPIAVAALRGRYNERDEFLMTTTPPLSNATFTSGTLVFPHIVSGQGFSTQIVVFGSSGTGKLYMFAKDGLLELGTPLK